ncbi:hypothetical protein N0V88_003608 [Collariella sp. IMI 366227]|nr:hypothetical protein N0V88_003608 [Collariella sp. IMI 366227]
MQRGQFYPRHQPRPPSPLPHPHQELQQPPQPISFRENFLSQRSLRQLGLFFGGAGFFCWSLAISRRAITRHQLTSQLRFFSPTQFALRPEQPKRNPMVAVEALNLATLNTLSFFIMAAGGLKWAFDISTVDDLRKWTRRSLEGVPVGTTAAGAAADEEAEQEVVEWVAKTLGLDLEQEQKAAGNGNGSGDGEGSGKTGK